MTVSGNFDSELWFNVISLALANMKRSEGPTNRAPKRQKVSSTTSTRSQHKEKEALEWPEYFHDVSGVFYGIDELSR